MGGGASFQPVVSENLWQKYFPDFAIPSENDGYTQSYPVNYSNPVLLMSFRKSYRNRFLESSHIRSSIGITLGLGSGYYSEERWSRNTITTIDSFTVAGNNNTYPIDSISDVSMSRSFQARDFMIGISQRFQTNPERRVTFHYGVDVLYGFTVNSSVSTTASSFTTFTPMVGSYEQVGSKYDSYEKRSYSGPRYQSIDAQFPLELCVKPFMRREQLRSFSTGLAFRPTVRWYYMDKEKGSLFQPWIGAIFRLAIE